MIARLLRQTSDGSARLLVFLGLRPGQVSEESASYFQSAGLAFAAIVVVCTIFGRVLGLAFLESTIVPAADTFLSFHFTHPRVVRILPAGTTGFVRWPYGYWASDGHKYIANVDTHPRVGEQFTVAYDVGGWSRYWVLNGNRIVTSRGYVPLWVSLPVLADVGGWLLSLVLAIWSFLMAGRIRRDLHAGSHTITARTRGVWCPWPDTYLRSVTFPLAVPLSLEDLDTGCHFNAYLSASRYLELGAPAKGQIVTLSMYPHTRAAVLTGPGRVRAEAHGTGRRRVLATHRRLLPLTNIGALATKGMTISRAIVRLRMAASFGFLTLALLASPALVPYWLPMHVDHTVVARVYKPYTSEPDGDPWGIRTRDGAHFYFIYDPKLRVGQPVTARWDWLWRFVDLTHADRRVDRGGVRNHPVAFVLVIAGAVLQFLWAWSRSRRRGRRGIAAGAGWQPQESA